MSLRCSFFFWRNLRNLLAGCCLLSAAACGGKQSSSLEALNAAQLSAGLPGIASLRAAAEVLSNVQNPENFFAASPDAVGGGGQVVLDASSHPSLQWAVWAFNPGELPLASVDVDLALGPDRECFIGKANFTRNVWEIDGPIEAGGTQTLELAGTDYLSPSGNAFIAVIADPDNTTSIGQITWKTIGNDPPVADIQADVTIGDAPLQVNFDASGSSDPDGSIVSYEWDISGSGTFLQNTGTVPTTVATYASPGIFNPTVRITDDDGITAIATLELRVTVNGNLPPIARLVADVQEGDGEAGFDVALTCESSEDLDGSISLYEWDLNNDGTFELSSANPDPQVLSISEPGEFTAKLRVTDNQGLLNNDSVKVVGHGWVKVPVGNFVWSSISLAMSGKGPGFAVSDSTGNCEFYQSSSNFGLDSGDWQTVNLGPAGVVGQGFSLIRANGRPAVAFRNQVNELSYARNNSGSALDAANWASVEVDDSSTSGSFATLVDGHPAIAYHTNEEFEVSEIRFALSSTETGSSAADWSHIVLDSENDDTSNGVVRALADIGGRAAIVYELPDKPDFYAFSQGGDGLAIEDWLFSEMPDSDIVSNHRSMVDVLGAPALCEIAPFAPDGVRFTRSLTADGGALSDWQVLPLLDSFGGTNTSTSIAVIDGRPFMLLGQKGLPLLFESSTPSGAAEVDWSSEEFDEPVDRCSAVIDVHGYPAFLYRDTTATTYAIRF
jgi:PKD repeat protein